MRYRKDVDRGARSLPNREIEGEIHTIAGGPYPGGRSQRSMKDYAREVRQGPSQGVFQVSRQSPQPPRKTTSQLTFTDADAEGVRFPHHDHLVVSALIRNHFVHRCLIDDGSSVDILYLDVFEKLRINPQSLRAAASPLHGFTGDSIFPEGSIELAVSFGEEPTRLTTISNFMVVKGRSSYNTILGRPTLVAMRAVTFIYHICPQVSHSWWRRSRPGESI